jgi:transcriptional regulator with XRE-family HTH domain
MLMRLSVRYIFIIHAFEFVVNRLGEIFMENFHERLKSCRKSMNKTQKQVADFLGVSIRAYQHYELNDREPPLSKAVALADFFDVSLDYLTGRSVKPK